MNTYPPGQRPPLLTRTLLFRVGFAGAKAPDMYAQNNTTPRKCCKSRCFGDTEHCLGVRSSTMQDASSEFRACCAPMYHGCSTSSAKPYSPPARPPAPPRGPFPRSLSLNARSVSRFETLVVPCVPCVPKARVVLQCSRGDSGVWCGRRTHIKTFSYACVRLSAGTGSVGVTRGCISSHKALEGGRSFLFSGHTRNKPAPRICDGLSQQELPSAK